MERACPVTLFDNFVNAATFRSIVHAFEQLCAACAVDPCDTPTLYQTLRVRLTAWKAQKLWALLDRRAAQNEYERQAACAGLRVLVVGAGPCGLRAAIECALLGARPVVVEKRERFSRNNVLHIWPFVIHDLKQLGAKIFYPKFCAGAIDHISIRQLQCILLKVALVLGVEVHDGVSFRELCSPIDDASTGTLVGWRARFDPANHYLEDWEFNAVVGADGKRNTLPGFPRREMRGKLAIGITANFTNRHTHAEERVQEISGVAFIFNQQFFKDMREQTGIDLENIVYYKDETHYFVMCAKKQSLIDKAVILRDFDDVAELLSTANVNQEALLAYARQAADFATDGALPRLDYAPNQHGLPDIGMFDFTSLFSAAHSSRVVERRGRRLLLCIVGDSLHEPFWPTGSGVARGFLGVLDSAWLLRGYAAPGSNVLQQLAQRESVYRLLAQATPENLHKNYSKYTIDPASRYPRADLIVRPEQLVHLVETDCPRSRALSANSVSLILPRSTSPDGFVERQRTIRFCQSALAPYRLRVFNLTDCWSDGLAVAALLNRFRPHLLDYASVKDCATGELRRHCVDVVEREFGLSLPFDLSGDGVDGDFFPCLSGLCGRFRAEMAEKCRVLAAAVASRDVRPSPVPAGSKKRRRSGEERVQSPRRRPVDMNDELAGVDELTNEEAECILREWADGEPADENERKKRIPLADCRPLKQRVRELGNSLAAKSVDSERKYTRRPGYIEKLNPERLHTVESLVSGESHRRARDDAFRKKRRAAEINTRKLGQHEIEEMETKLRDTGMGCLFRKDADKLKAMSRQDELMIRAKTADVRKFAEHGFKDVNSKFTEIDERLKELDKQLADSAKAAPSSVADLTKLHKRQVLLNGAARKAPVPLPGEKPVASPREGGAVSACQPTCVVCEATVYLAERILVEGQFVHKRCFRCAVCKAPLRLASYGFDRSLPSRGRRFFCSAHLNLPLKDKLDKLAAPDAIGRTAANGGDACSVPTAVVSPTVKTPRPGGERNGDVADVATPERAQFEYTPLDNVSDDRSSSSASSSHSVDGESADDDLNDRKSNDVDDRSDSSDFDELSDDEVDELEVTMAAKQSTMDASLTWDEAASLAKSWQSRRSCQLRPISATDLADGQSTPPDDQPPGDPPASVRKEALAELERVREAARARARLKSDEELGLPPLRALRSQLSVPPILEAAALRDCRSASVVDSSHTASSPSERRRAQSLLSFGESTPSCESAKETRLLSQLSENKFKLRKSKSPTNRPLGTDGADVATRDVRRVQRAAERLARRREQSRRLAAQDLQRRLQEVDVRRGDIAATGGDLERRLASDAQNRALLEQWLALASERDSLERYGADLELRARHVDLQQRHAALQEQWRARPVAPTMSSTELEAERKLLEEMVSVNSQQDAIVKQTEWRGAKGDADQLTIAERLERRSFDYRNFEPIFL